MPEVNVVLVPEVEFDLEGENGLLEFVRKRLEAKHHCVIVVAEGAGQNLFQKDKEVLKDPSGNIIHQDIGIHLKIKIKEYLNEKYI